MFTYIFRWYMLRISGFCGCTLFYFFYRFYLSQQRKRRIKYLNQLIVKAKEEREVQLERLEESFNPRYAASDVDIARLEWIETLSFAQFIGEICLTGI